MNVKNMTLILNKKKFTNLTAIIILLATFKVLFHLILPEYGYLRDELYYISIGDQFSFSNLDMLPLSPLYLKLLTTIFGYSIKTIHLASSLLGAAALVFTCLMTKELGGKSYAVLITGVFILFSGFTPFGSIFTYDSMDFLIIVISLYLLVRIIKTDNTQLWYYVGIVLGLGLFNKLTILFYGLAIFISLFLVPQRKMYRRKEIWLAGIIALLFLIPYLIWQSQNDWYFLEFASGYSGGISYLASFPEFLWNQILPNNIISLPVWLTGLYLLLFSTNWKMYRFFGIMYLFLFFLFYLIGAKFYFLIPMYTILLAAGSVKLEEKINLSRNLKLAIPILYIILSLPLLPMMVPLLPVSDFIKYAAILGVDAGVKFENNRINRLPQYFADRFGWEELVQDISEEFHTIPKENIADAGIMTNNWGIASAIHFYSSRYKLPQPISNAGWFCFESLRKNEYKNNYISIGFSEELLCYLFDSVTKKRVFTNPYCMPHENNRAIFFCANPRVEIGKYFSVERKIDPDFLSILSTEGAGKAVAFYKKQKAINAKTVLFTEYQINSLGYEYLSKNLISEAISLFKLNVEEHPESFNVFDSLGDGYMRAKKYELAVVNYKKSIELNPDNTHGKNKLNELKNLMGH